MQPGKKAQVRESFKDEAMLPLSLNRLSTLKGSTLYKGESMSSENQEQFSWLEYTVSKQDNRSIWRAKRDQTYH